MAEATAPEGQEGNSPAPPQPDIINNLKAEQDRKIGNVMAQLEEIKKMVQPVKREEPVSEEDDDLLYKNPREYKRRLETQITEKVGQTLSKTIEETKRADNERLQTLASLAQEYPDLNKSDTPLYQEALKVLNTLPEGQRQSAQGYQYAVLRAAANIGEVPVNKKTDPGKNKDDFSFSGKSQKSPQKKASKEDLDPKVLQWAEFMGVDVNDDKEIEDLKKYAKRDFRRPE